VAVVDVSSDARASRKLLVKKPNMLSIDVVTISSAIEAKPAPTGIVVNLGAYMPTIAFDGWLTIAL
jgi:hypothetical protein